MYRVGYCGYPLHFVGKSDEQWLAEARQHPAMCEEPVVVAPPHADAIAAFIKTHQWQEHRVEFTCRAPRPSHRFQYPVGSAPYRATPVMKAHAVMARTDDARQCNLAAALARQSNERRRVDFLGGGKIQADAPAWSQQPGGIDLARERTRCGLPRAALDGAPQGP